MNREEENAWCAAGTREDGLEDTVNFFAMGSESMRLDIDATVAVDAHIGAGSTGQAQRRLSGPAAMGRAH